ncbi:MAG: hypothetical protein MUF05_03405 [Candidatus Omnitrophica bacterium]|jgi:O-antigen/teichoic acid export membrane protein|nr:hypothetical protein [Candidatus Omnitrophota bacterium]
MTAKINQSDDFLKNILVVFFGATLVNICNLLFQLFIAHSFTPIDFASFNALLSFVMILSAPLANLQVVSAKFCASYRSGNDLAKLRYFLQEFIRRTTWMGIISLVLFYVFSVFMLDKLKIDSPYSAYLLAILFALSWVVPVVSGGVQGIEAFKWLSFILAASHILKLACAVFLIKIGLGIPGAFMAFLISSAAIVILSVIPLRNIIFAPYVRQDVDFNRKITFIFPVMAASFVYMMLINADMILVKYFFSAQESGIYAVYQMVGKIFLFLPAAVATVIFPKTSSLSSKNMQTHHFLRRGLLYAGFLVLCAAIFYNLFPVFTLKVLTGKAMPEAVFLGRMFSVSMSFFTLCSILFYYFLSISDFRFLKYFFLAAVLQLALISLFHTALFQVQLIMCVNSFALFLIFMFLGFKKGIPR